MAENKDNKQNTDPLGSQAEDWYDRNVKPWTWLKNIIVNAVKNVFDAVTYGVATGLSAITSPFRKESPDNAGTANTGAVNAASSEYNVAKDKALLATLKEHGAVLNKDMTVSIPGCKPIQLTNPANYKAVITDLDTGIRKAAQEQIKLHGFQADHSLEKLFILDEGIGCGHRDKSDFLYASMAVDTSNVRADGDTVHGTGTYNGRSFTFTYNKDGTLWADVIGKDGKPIIIPQNVSEHLKQCSAQELAAREKLLKECAFFEVKDVSGGITGKIAYKGEIYDFAYKDKLKTAAPLSPDLLEAAGREAYHLAVSKDERDRAGINTASILNNNVPIQDIYIRKDMQSGRFKTNGKDTVRFSVNDGRIICSPEMKLSLQDEFRIKEAILEKQNPVVAAQVKMISSEKDVAGHKTASFRVNDMEVNAALNQDGSFFCPSSNLTPAERNYIEQILNITPDSNIQREVPKRNPSVDHDLVNMMSTQPFTCECLNDGNLSVTGPAGSFMLEGNRYERTETLRRELPKQLSHGYSMFSNENRNTKDLILAVSDDAVFFSNLNYKDKDSMSGTIETKEGKFNFVFDEGDIIFNNLPQSADKLVLTKQARDACETENSFRLGAQKHFSSIDVKNGKFVTKGNVPHSFAYDGKNFRSDANLSPMEAEYLKTLCREQGAFNNFYVGNPGQLIKLNINNKDVEFRTIPFTTSQIDYTFAYNMQNDMFIVLDQKGNSVTDPSSVISGKQFSELKLAALQDTIKDLEINRCTITPDNKIHGTYKYKGKTYKLENGKPKNISGDAYLCVQRQIALVPHDGNTYSIGTAGIKKTSQREVDR